MTLSGGASGARGLHLVLIGLPGSGKSTVGRRVAAELDRPFVDFDEEIVARTGRSVAQLFAEEGESEFRKREHAISIEQAAAPAAVLAPGGGWITVEAAVAVLRPRARLVWLRVTPETALSRLALDPVRRPLLAGPDPLDRLRALEAARASQYGTADLVVDSEVDDLQGVVSDVLAYARDACRVVDPSL